MQVEYRGRLGVEVGMFVAVDHLRRAGRLSPAEETRYFDIDDWFNENLLNPDFYADGNSVGAVTWFKAPIPPVMQELIDELCGMLTAHGVAYHRVTSDDPGKVIYEDEFQVGVVPHVRGEPTPPPEGITLTPTTAGSKRAVAESSVRHVLLDADGVLQDLPGGWYAAMEPYLGDRAREFLHETWADEMPMLAGCGDYMPVLAATLQTTVWSRRWPRCTPRSGRTLRSSRNRSGSCKHLRGTDTASIWGRIRNATVAVTCGQPLGTTTCST
jgi:hypothetical protein